MTRAGRGVDLAVVLLMGMTVTTLIGVVTVAGEIRDLLRGPA
jgi:hypothetical protein